MQKKTRTEYSYLNIIAGVGGYSISIILSLINRMVFTRTLPASYLGINGLFSNILSMLSLAELGVGGAIVYALYKPLAEDDEEKIASLVQLFGKAYIIIGLVIAGLGICLMPFLSVIVGEHPEIKDNLLLIFALYLFSTASSYFFTYRSTLLTAAQMNYYNTGINYLVISVQEVIQAIYLICFRNYVGYLILQVLFGLIYNIIISRVAVKKFPFIIKKDIKPLSKEESKAVFCNVRDLMIYKISGVLVNGTDNVIITLFDGLDITGFASNYSLLVNTLSSLLNQIFNSITASLGNLNASESKEKRFSILNMLNLANFWFFGWGTIGIIFVSSDLVSLLFGSEYVLNIKIPVVLALNFYSVGMMNTIWNFKHTMGMFKYGRFIQFWTAVFNLTFSIALGRIWGLFGILLATFIARALTNMWYDPYVVFKYGFKETPIKYIKKYIFYLIILIITGGICFVSCQWINYSPLINVILKGSICSVVVNVIFYFVFAKSDEFLIVKQIISKGVDLIKSKLSKRKRDI